MHITDSRIAEARRHCQAATPGPYGVLRTGTGPLGWSVVAGITHDGPRWHIASTCREEDAQAIANALSNLPLALDDLAELRADPERLRTVAQAATAARTQP